MNNKFIRLIIGLAVVANLATLAFWLFQRPPLPPEDVLVNALKLDDAQYRKFAVMKKQDRQRRDSLAQVMGRYRQALYQELLPAVKTSQTDSLLTAIGQTFVQLERSTYQHFRDIRALCRPDQQAKLDTLLVEITQKFQQKRSHKRR